MIMPSGYSDRVSKGDFKMVIDEGLLQKDGLSDLKPRFHLRWLKFLVEKKFFADFDDTLKIINETVEFLSKEAETTATKNSNYKKRRTEKINVASKQLSDFLSYFKW